jgi:hypothetical protein
VLPARSRVQSKARAEKRSELSQNLSAPSGNVAVEGLGRAPWGGSGREEPEGERGQVAIQRTRGRGGGAFLTNPQAPDGGEREITRYLWAAEWLCLC